MKSAYIKPETEILFAQLNAAIAITSSERNGRPGDKGEETPPQGGENEDPAKRFDLDWDFEDLTSDWDLNE